MTTTAYIISIPGRSYLEVLAGSFYSWTGKPSKAKKFVGREAAEAAANQLEAAITANGYKCKVTVKPARGGMEISRKR